METGGFRSELTLHRRSNEGNCETSLPKLRNGRLKEAESPGYGSPQNERDASLISLRFGDQQRREHFTRKRLIAHVCPGNRPKSPSIDANNAIPCSSLDQKWQGHGILERWPVLCAAEC